MAALVVWDGSVSVSVEVDASALGHLSAFEWKMHRNATGTAYPARWDKRTRKWVYLHVEAWMLYNGWQARPPLEVDHRDNDLLNCKESNLRLASRSDNSANRRRASTVKNPYRGVSQVKKTGRWQARIRVQRKVYSLGTYDTPMEAAKAYDREAVYRFGQFARPNF